MRGRGVGSSSGDVDNNEESIHVASTRTSGINGDEASLHIAGKDLSHLNGGKSSGKGKAPVRPNEQDVDMMDIDDSHLDSEIDNVTEYSFKSEDYPHDSELEESDEEDARSHISLSDDEAEVSPLIEGVDWKGLNRDQRVAYERMFGTAHHRPINGSWNVTENYHRFVDDQCLSYLDAYKPEEWILPRQDTEFILNKLLERVRMRKLHIKIYGPQQPHNHHSQSPHPQPGHVVPDHQMLRSQPSLQPINVTPGVKLGQPLRQPMAFAQAQHYPNGNLPPGVRSGQLPRGPAYPMPGQLQQQGFRSSMGQPNGGSAKIPRKLKINVGDRGNKEPTLQIPVPLKAPTPPYPTRDRPDQRKTVGKSGRGKTRRQAEADEFPWNRQLDFVAAKEAAKSKESWDDSVYDATMLAEMARTRVRNEPVVAVLEEEITAKQSKYTSNHCEKWLRILIQAQRWLARRRASQSKPKSARRKKAKERRKLSKKIKMVLVVLKGAGRRIAPLGRQAVILIIQAILPSPDQKTNSLLPLWVCAQLTN